MTWPYELARNDPERRKCNSEYCNSIQLPLYNYCILHMLIALLCKFLRRDMFCRASMMSDLHAGSISSFSQLAPMTTATPQQTHASRTALPVDYTAIDSNSCSEKASTASPLQHISKWSKVSNQPAQLIAAQTARLPSRSGCKTDGRIRNAVPIAKTSPAAANPVRQEAAAGAHGQLIFGLLRQSTF